jgi:hypothetical protein
MVAGFAGPRLRGLAASELQSLTIGRSHSAESLDPGATIGSRAGALVYNFAAVGWPEIHKF